MEKIIYPKPEIDESLMLADACYQHDATNKRTIVIHGTGGGTAESSIAWNAGAVERGEGTVAVAYYIARNGHIYQAMKDPLHSSWGWHLAEASHVFKNDKESIAIELATWNQLILGDDGNFYPDYQNAKPVEPACVYDITEGNGIDWNFRGFRYYERLYPKQLAALKALLLWISQETGIPLARCKASREVTDVPFNTHFFSISEEAKQGAPGVRTHVSYKLDKTDLSPQVPLMMMLEECRAEWIANLRK
jgi:hypothetical protein